jgi:hypothetical protein
LITERWAAEAEAVAKQRRSGVVAAHVVALEARVERQSSAGCAGTSGRWLLRSWAISVRTGLQRAQSEVLTESLRTEALRLLAAKGRCRRRSAAAARLQLDQAMAAGSREGRRGGRQA